MKSDCVIIILTYQGLRHLQYLLPTVRECIENTRNYSFEVLIIENGNDDGSEKYVMENFSSFRYRYSPSNDYLFSINAFAREVEAPFIFVLNNDLRLHPDVLNKSLPLIIGDENIFAVSCTLMDWDGNKIQEAVRTMNVEKGWLYLKNEPYDSESIRYTLNACGGASLYRTAMFNKLGGYDRLYYPAYYEDVDLSHRAWHTGWKIVHHPKAIVYHREGASWTTEGREDNRSRLIERNKVMGMIRNCDFPGFLTQFFLMLPFRYWRSRKMNKSLNHAFKQFFPLLITVLKSRFKTPRHVTKDNELIKILGTKYN